MAFAKAQINRHRLLSLLPDTFSTAQAAAAWRLPQSGASSHIDYMRKYGLLKTVGPRGRRVHIKVSK